MFVAEAQLKEAWALKDSGVPIEEVERLCGGDAIKEKNLLKFHAKCVRCEGKGEVARVGGSGVTPVVNVEMAGELSTASEVPTRAIARTTKRAGREAIAPALVEWSPR